MKLSSNAIIAPEKIKDYLLKWQPEGDKSNFLAKAGYHRRNWKQLEYDLREQVLPLKAVLNEQTNYGDVYQIRGKLTGPNGSQIKIVTIWMIEYVSQQTKFITLYPDKEG